MDSCVDVSVVLRIGVYLLWHNGSPVFAGKSRCPIVQIAAHRSLARKTTPSWFPFRGIVFDRVEVFPSHPDRIDTLLARTIATYKPRLNLKLVPHEHVSKARHCA